MKKVVDKRKTPMYNHLGVKNLMLRSLGLSEFWGERCDYRYFKYCNIVRTESLTEKVQIELESFVSRLGEFPIIEKAADMIYRSQTLMAAAAAYHVALWIWQHSNTV